MNDHNISLSIQGSKEFKMILDKLNQILKDTDDEESKEMIRNFLKTVSDVVKILVIGEEGSGRTTFWQSLLLDYGKEEITATSGVEEVRYGDEDFFFQVEDGYTRRFCKKQELEGIAVFDTGSKNELKKERIRELAESSDVIFVVLPSDNIQCPAVWDFLERRLNWKKVVFIMSKSDLLSEAQMEEKLEKLTVFIKEAGIVSPVFPVLLNRGSISENGVEPVKQFVMNSIIGNSPKQSKVQENIHRVISFLQELKNSFEQRYAQFEVDYKILQRIDQQMNEYRKEQEALIQNLDAEVCKEIDERILEYEQEIITRLNPKTIKERFHKKEEFQNYLELVNQNYQTILNKAVERKVQSSIKRYLNDLEIVYEQASAGLSKRPVFLELEDRFYGSLAKSKYEIVRETKEMALATYEFYQTLSSASEELFLKIWKERQKFDKVVNRSTAAGVVGGAAGGAVGAAALSAALKTGVSAALVNVFGNSAFVTSLGTAIDASMLAVGSGILIPVIAIAGAVSLGIFANKLAKAMASPHMEQEVNQCIEEFKIEVADIRKNIKECVLSEIHQLFDRELNRVDKSFTEFRVATNIDSKRLPELKESLRMIEEIAELGNLL